MLKSFSEKIAVQVKKVSHVYINLYLEAVIMIFIVHTCHPIPLVYTQMTLLMLSRATGCT